MASETFMIKGLRQNWTIRPKACAYEIQNEKRLKDFFLGKKFRVKNYLQRPPKQRHYTVQLERFFCSPNRCRWKILPKFLPLQRRRATKFQKKYLLKYSKFNKLVFLQCLTRLIRIKDSFNRYRTVWRGVERGAERNVHERDT